MAGDYDNAVFRSRKFHNDVVNGKAAFGGCDFKIVALDLVALEVSENVILRFLMPFASQRARTESNDFFYVLHRAAGIEGRRRAVGRHRRRLGCIGWCGW